MGEIPTPVNKPAQTVGAIINAAIFQVGVKAAMTALIAEAPWIGLPVIRQIVEILVNRVAQPIYVALAMFTTFRIIDFQTEQELTVYEKAEGELRAAHLSGDPNALAEASKKFDAALGSLIHWDGSATP